MEQLVELWHPLGEDGGLSLYQSSLKEVLMFTFLIMAFITGKVGEVLRGGVGWWRS